jgi:UDP-glucose 4-epimerase
MVLPTFVRQALAGRAITVHGDGTQRRCFGYVGDVVKALVTLVETPAAYGSVFNVGSDEEVSIMDLALRVKEATGSSSEIVTIPYEKAWDDQFEDMLRRVPDLTKVKALIGYEPKTRLDEIIGKLIEFERASD